MFTKQKVFFYLSTDRTTSRVLSLVGGVLHAGRHEAVAAQQMSLQTLVREEAELTFLAVEWRTVVDHFRVDFYLDKYFVISFLIGIFYR